MTSRFDDVDYVDRKATLVFIAFIAIVILILLFIWVIIYPSLTTFEVVDKRKVLVNTTTEVGASSDGNVNIKNGISLKNQESCLSSNGTWSSDKCQCIEPYYGP